MRFALLIPLIAVLAAAPPPARPGAALPGTIAPTFEATGLDGARYTGAIPGKVTVLNFWATWCPPCRAETPDMVRSYGKLHAADVAFLGIDTTETAPIIKTFLSAKGVPYPTALAGPEVYNAYAITGIPTTVVVDAGGVVRARWVGEISPAQLAQFVADARAGRNAPPYTSPAQKKIDALLAPDRFAFDDPAKRDAAVASALAAIAKVDDIVDTDDSVDYERTSREEGALLVRAGTVVVAHAATPSRKVTGYSLQARGYGMLFDWPRSEAALKSALAIAPNTPKLIAALSRTYYRLHDYGRMIATAQRYTQLRPDDGDGWSDLGLAYQRLGEFSAALPPYHRSLALLRAAAAKAPTQDNIADVADTSLDLADVYVSLGDVAGARATFDQANAYGDRLTAGGEYARLKRNVRERTQEGMVAVALASGTSHPVVSIAPWTGPDLPGSVSSTLKYRLIVAAPAKHTVTLVARGLRPDWIASFCTDGLCSPQTVSFEAPASGVKTYEFQLVPPSAGAEPGSVAVAVDGGPTVAVPPIAARSATH